MKTPPPLLLALPLALLGSPSCGGDAPGNGDNQATLVPLDGARLLRRMSLDLRGDLPSLAEQTEADDDPDEVEAIRDTFFDDPRFEERLVWLMAEHWLTTSDTYVIHSYEYGLDDTQDYAWKRSVGQEPLRLMARIAAEDRHWSEVVTADFTMATEVTASLWPLSGYPEGGTGWHPVTWTDGRPAAGVLATNGLWWRYLSNEYNLSRSRVAAISRLLTCEDLLSREVTFENAAALLEADSVAAMVKTEESCLACHATVEPMAAALFGFRWTSDYGVQEMERYHPERELGGESSLGVEMAYWGEPINGLADLGAAIARDERFWRCTAETFTTGLYRRPLGLDDRADVDRALAALLDGDGRLWAMLEEITGEPAYRAGALSGSGAESTLGRHMLARPISPDQLARSLEGLTGFRWTWEGYDQLDNDDWGYRIQLGGLDGQAVTRPASTPTLGATIAAKRIAEAAAAFEVAEHLGQGGDTVLGGVDLRARPGDAAFDRDLAEAWYRLTALTADDELMAGLRTLWAEVEATSGPEMAWEATFCAMLRDPLFLTY